MLILFTPPSSAFHKRVQRHTHKVIYIFKYANEIQITTLLTPPPTRTTCNSSSSNNNNNNKNKNKNNNNNNNNNNNSNNSIQQLYNNININPKAK